MWYNTLHHAQMSVKDFIFTPLLVGLMWLSTHFKIAFPTVLLYSIRLSIRLYSLSLYRDILNKLTFGTGLNTEQFESMSNVSFIPYSGSINTQKDKEGEREEVWQCKRDKESGTFQEIRWFNRCCFILNKCIHHLTRVSFRFFFFRGENEALFFRTVLCRRLVLFFFYFFFVHP